MKHPHHSNNGFATWGGTNLFFPLPKAVCQSHNSGSSQTKERRVLIDWWLFTASCELNWVGIDSQVYTVTSMKFQEFLLKGKKNNGSSYYCPWLKKTALTLTLWIVCTSLTNKKHYLLNLEKFKIFIKIHTNIAPTCFGLRVAFCTARNTHSALWHAATSPNNI